MIRIESTGELMTLQEAAALYQVSVPSLRKALELGEIPGVRIGVQWRVFKLVPVSDDNPPQKNVDKDNKIS